MSGLSGVFTEQTEKLSWIFLFEVTKETDKNVKIWNFLTRKRKKKRKSRRTRVKAKYFNPASSKSKVSADYKMAIFTMLTICQI